eukprot:TRINITY_DN51391_c0_g1_i1.p1 TRINITY_DN51391_c0_g1~~TRINITY_DN51391_c0_g1_i1.p1  ORF type:complete len:265 (-),score=67.35 TRINITY_DN51391_c0_g1_i1:82-876(-)
MTDRYDEEFDPTSPDAVKQLTQLQKRERDQNVHTMWLKDQALCLQLYKKAHDERADEFEHRACELEHRADETGSKNCAVALKSQANRVREVKNRSNFEDWYLDDMILFKKCDASGNGYLEYNEYREFAQRAFQMSEEEAEQGFTAWDIDEGASIGPFEFVTMMSVWHTEQDFHKAMLVSQLELDDHDARSCACCAPHALVFGAGCSLFTIGLSWIPYCCLKQSTETTPEEKAEKRKMRASAMARGRETAFVECRKRILLSLIHI